MAESGNNAIIRRLAQSSTSSTFDQKTECIAYNYATRKLSKESKASIEGLWESCAVILTHVDNPIDAAFLEVDLPRSGRWLDIYLPVKGSSAKFYLATVDLHRLGRSVKTKRQQGTLNTLYIVGKVDIHTEDTRS